MVSVIFVFEEETSIVLDLLFTLVSLFIPDSQLVIDLIDIFHLTKLHPAFLQKRLISDIVSYLTTVDLSVQ